MDRLDRRPGLGVVLGAVFLMPGDHPRWWRACSSTRSPTMSSASIIRPERPGTAPAVGLGHDEGVKTALLTILVYLIALPFVFVRRRGFIAFFIATAWLLGREYRARRDAVSFARGNQGDAQTKMPRSFLPRALVIAHSYRIRSSTSRRLCSAWLLSWFTCTSGYPGPRPN